jgi:iron complex outermembrane recepter protein
MRETGPRHRLPAGPHGVAVALCCGALVAALCARGQAEPPPIREPRWASGSASVEEHEAAKKGRAVEVPLTEEEARRTYRTEITAHRMTMPARESPMATTVVEREELRAMPRSVGAEEALRLVPGVKVENQANGERVHLSIRGVGILTERGIRGIKVLLDGLPLNDPTGFCPDLFDVDWATVERIEVLRGPAAALYGGGSSGGVISISTRDGPPEPFAAGASGTVGSNAFWKGLLEAGGRTGRFDYRLSASRTMGDGWREHTRFNATNIYGKVNWAPTPEARLTVVVAGTGFYNQNPEGLNLSWIASDADWARANPDAAKYNEDHRTTRVTVGVSGHAALAARLRIAFSLYYRTTDYSEAVPSSALYRTLSSPGATLQVQLPSGSGWLRNTVALGGDFDAQSIDENRRFNAPVGGWSDEDKKTLDLTKPYLALQTVAQRGVGVYLSDRLELGRDLAAMASARYDHVSSSLRDLLKADGVDLSGERSFQRVTGRLGLAWNPLREIGAYASWGMGFLPPATEEMMANPDALGGFNARLKEATSMGEDVGVRGVLFGRLLYDLCFFHTETRDDFYRFRVPGPTRVLETFYGNAGETRRLGLEATLVARPLAGLTLRAAYTLSSFVYTSLTIPEPVLDAAGSPVVDYLGTSVLRRSRYDSKNLPSSPVHRAALDAEYAFTWRTLRGLYLGVGVDLASSAYVDWTNVASIDGYALLSPRLGYRFSLGRWPGEVAVTGRNVLSQHWIAFTEPDPDGNSYQPGPPAEVFVTLRLGVGS